jgi:hypothetical protein
MAADSAARGKLPLEVIQWFANEACLAIFAETSPTFGDGQVFSFMQRQEPWLRRKNYKLHHQRLRISLANIVAQKRLGQRPRFARTRETLRHRLIMSLSVRFVPKIHFIRHLQRPLLRRGIAALPGKRRHTWSRPPNVGSENP